MLDTKSPPALRGTAYAWSITGRPHTKMSLDLNVDVAHSGLATFSGNETYLTEPISMTGENWSVSTLSRSMEPDQSHVKRVLMNAVGLTQS